MYTIVEGQMKEDNFDLKKNRNIKGSADNGNHSLSKCLLAVYQQGWLSRVLAGMSDDCVRVSDPALGPSLVLNTYDAFEMVCKEVRIITYRATQPD
ncbi:hypothetical protein J6590_007424 [Homalodisca vitripennis]|nr:hypothetical protein J6590_007424 [Homalodisca vitripennis]